MRPLFEVTSAKVKKAQADLPAHQSMRASGSGDIRRNPSTDQKKVRRQMTKKAASLPTAIAGEGAYVTNSFDSSIRKEVPAGTPAQAVRAFQTWAGTRSYDWSVEGVDGDQWQLGGNWERQVSASRRIAAWTQTTESVSVYEGLVQSVVTYVSDDGQAMVVEDVVGRSGWLWDAEGRDGEQGSGSEATLEAAQSAASAFVSQHDELAGQMALFASRKHAGPMFPGPGAQVYYNDAGEPLGWDEAYDPDPNDAYDDEMTSRGDSMSDAEWEEGYEEGESAGKARDDGRLTFSRRNGFVYTNQMGGWEYVSEAWAAGFKEGWATVTGHDAIIAESSLKTATDWDQVDADWNASYWKGQALAEEAKERRRQQMYDMKGKKIVIVKGRKIPVGTTGTAFYVGEGTWGWRVGFTDEMGNTLWTDIANVELADESKVASRRTAVSAAEVDKAWNDLNEEFENSDLDKLTMNDMQLQADSHAGDPDWDSDEPDQLAKQMRSIELMRKWVKQRSGGRKVAAIRWEYLEDYGYFVNPNAFVPYYWAKIEQKGASFLAIVLAATGDDYTGDTVVFTEVCSTVEEAKAAVEGKRLELLAGRTASRKVAWTEDGSDISDLALKVMNAYEDIVGEASASDASDDRYRSAVQAAFSQAVAPFLSEITQKDLDVLEDYNYHTAIRLVLDAAEAAGVRIASKTAYTNWEDTEADDESGGWYTVDADGEPIDGPFDSKEEAEASATDDDDDSEGEDGDSSPRVKHLSLFSPPPNFANDDLYKSEDFMEAANVELPSPKPEEGDDSAPKVAHWNDRDANDLRPAYARSASLHVAANPYLGGTLDACLSNMLAIASEARSSTEAAIEQYPNGGFSASYADTYASSVERLVRDLVAAASAGFYKEAFRFAMDRLSSIENVEGDGDYTWATKACRRMVDSLLISRPDWLRRSAARTSRPNL
jgi:hypothetical protein